MGSVCRMLLEALVCREAVPHSLVRTIGRRCNDVFHGRAYTHSQLAEGDSFSNRLKCAGIKEAGPYISEERLGSIMVQACSFAAPFLCLRA